MMRDRSFFGQEADTVARELLGDRLVHETGEGRVVGRIVETEAYFGEDDPASHAYRGKTGRNEVMFGGPGVAYVYKCYGIHDLFNITTGEENDPQAVLIRAVEPIEGFDLMKQRRDSEELTVLCNGPGKLSEAFDIDTSMTGIAVTGEPLFVKEGEKSEEVKKTGRIGVNGGEELLLRFVEAGSRFVSG